MNINRDYLIINDVKKSSITLNNGSMFFYITDKNTQNIFVNLVINVSNNDLIQKYANIENAEDYTLTMNIVKPSNTYKIIEGKLHDKEEAIFEFNLNEDCCDEIGTYRCELLTKCNINGHEEITTSNSLTYKVNSSILNDLDDIVEAPEYPIVIQLFDKLSDIEQYEENRRANELARQLAEQQRQTRFDALNADMTDSIQAIDNKVMDVENRVSIKEQAVDKLIVDTKADIDEYKIAKDQEIDEAINAQNDRLNAIEVKNQQQDDRLLDIEKVNKRQDIDLKCLFTEAKNNMIDITEEGNSIYLQNSNEGHVFLDEIKGNTLVNCNKEPNKELILNGNINTSGDNTVTLTEGVDSGLVDVALEGNTLVNVSKTKDSTALPLNEDLTYLYANTQYTVQFISTKAITADITLGGTQLLAQSIVVGLNRISITTPATLVDNKLIIDGVGANISEVVVTNTDRKFGYFEGMKSVGECEELEVKSSNKNLIDPSKVVRGKRIDSQTGEVVGDSSYYALVDYVPIQPNMPLIYSVTKVGTEISPINGTLFHFYDINKKHIYSCWILSTGKLPDSVINGKTPSNAYYLRISYGINDGWGTSYESLLTGQLEEGSTATDYIPHQSNTQQLTHEPLRAVGDARDRYVLIDGKWYIERNCGEVTLDGSEQWTKHSLNVPKCVRFQTQIINAYCNNNAIYSICDKFKVVVNIGWKLDEEKLEMDYLKNLGITISKDKLSTQDENGFKQWLQNNPTKVVYQLETPIYEPFEIEPVLSTYNNVTHISNNSTIPCNMTIKNTGFNCLLKPSTTYTISSNLGLNTVTTPSKLTEDCLRFMDTDTSDVTTMKDVLVLEGDWTSKADLIPANFSRIESAFEQEYDAEKGKYKVNVKVVNEDKSKENNITFYINEPLRGIRAAKDRIYIKNDKVVVQRNCGIRPYEDGDFGTYLTDKVNTVYPLAEPVYEEVEYNDTKLFIESFKNSTLFYNSNVPVTSKLYYSYSVPIVDTVAQTASISDEQDTLITDMAVQVAVLEMMTL